MINNKNTDNNTLDSALIIDQDALMTDGEPIEWDDDKYVWDIEELKVINKQRIKAGKPKIEIVKKHTEADLGIRAHPDMSIGKLLGSMFLPH